MKIILIGGTGVLSTSIAELSIARGHQVYVLYRGNRMEYVHPKAIMLKADIKDKPKVKKILGELQFDITIDFLSFNVNDLKNSLSIFSNISKQFMFISSCSVYLEPDENGLFTEKSTLIDPIWDYSVNKVKCEKYIKDYCPKIGLKYTIIRPAITYGDTRLPFSLTPAYGWHWTIIGRILNNKPLLIWDNGKNITTLTHVTDFAKGVVGLIGNPKGYNDEFHITSDFNYTWHDVADTIGEIIGKTPIYANIQKEFIINKMPSLRGLILGSRAKNTKFDNSKIKETVPKFSCTIPMKVGIKKTINYYIENNYLHGIDYFWDGQMDWLLERYYEEGSSVTFNNNNLHFIKYLPHTNIVDRVAYFLGKSNNDFLFRIFNKFTNYYSK